MPIQNYIKHGYENEELSINEIARRTGVCWRTAAKYAKQEDWNRPAMEKRKKHQPVMDAVAEIVDTWLLEDRLLKRKQRRNAAAIYRQLCTQHGFQGSERTVRQYVQRRRAELFQHEKTPYVELAHPAGHAQVDFGTDTIVRNGKFTDIQGLRLSFPFSNAGFISPMPAQNELCFLEGMKRLFERVGGVPSNIVFDNLSAAVVSIGKGEERTLTDMFTRFMLHYGFKADFCAPRKGNEKGNVENKVGYTRRQWLCPLQSLKSFESLEEQLWNRSLQDMERLHYKKGETIAALWEQERTSLLPLPRVPFEVSYLDHAILNNYAQFKFEKVTYAAPKGEPQHKVLLTVFWDRIEVRDQQGTLLAAPPRQYMLKEEEIDWAAHFEIYGRRPRSAIHSALFPYLPKSVQQFLQEAEPAVRSTRVRLLRDVLKMYTMAQVTSALEALPSDRQDDRTSLEQKLYALDPANSLPKPMREDYTPSEVAGYEPDASIYDLLSPARRKEGAPNEHTVNA